MMKDYLKKLKSQIEAEPLTFYDDGDIPVLESLYFHYIECYCLNSDLANQLAREIHEQLSGLSFSDSDAVCCLANKLAAEHERIGFIAGLQFGAQLMLELRKEIVQ